MTHIAIPHLSAVAFGFWLLPFLANPANAGCTPLTSTASPVTNSTVTCTGVTQSQNVETVPFNFDAGYGTFNETGDIIDVQPMASVTGLTVGFALGDGNTVNNSGAIAGGGFGIKTTMGSTISVNNLTTTSTISGTDALGGGLDVTNVIVSNAGTIAGDTKGILASGTVILSSNTGSITGTGSLGTGISAASVSGSNAGMIAGAAGIDTGSDINLTSNTGTIEGNNGFAITTGGNVIVGANSAA